MEESQKTRKRECVTLHPLYIYIPRFPRVLLSKLLRRVSFETKS